MAFNIKKYNNTGYDFGRAIASANKKIAIENNSPEQRAINNIKHPKVPKTNPAPNEPSKQNGNLSTDDFEKRVNNDLVNNPDPSSSNQSADNPNNDDKNDLNYKKNGIENPNNDSNDINPEIHQNKTPTQRISELAQLLDQEGVPTKWERALPCPCMTTSGQPQINCPICHGLGLDFEDPVELKVDFQGDNRGYYNGQYGVIDNGQAIATPQITENGLENGIGPRDRLEAEGFIVPQTYIFNVDRNRINTGEFIPYKVESIDQAETIKGNHKILLHEGTDFTFNKAASILTPNNKWLNYSISLRMSVQLRYYVVNILKETRNAVTSDLRVKKMLYGENHPNKILNSYARKYNRLMQPGDVYLRMPKKLLLKRENTVIGNFDFNNSKTKKKRNIKYRESQVTNNPNNPLNLW